MSLASRAGDLFYTFRFIKLLVTNWTDTDAFKLGIIDENGKRIKTKKVTTPEEKSAYTTFHRLVYNVKRLIPGGSKKLVSLASALYLIKENLGISDKNLNKILEESNIELLDLLSEEHEWFYMPNGQISPGIYKVINDKLLSVNLEEIVYAKDKIRVSENCFPIDEVLGLKIYEGKHINTNQAVHFTVGEIYR